ncbi:LysR family transcriptional regulator [Pokkaliibacter plantistimulans]|uniref:LysR family transcriptional regulator n=2 Tax=Pseudomonadota TaxID=1224 RepID=A0ABX5M192_9GAMM|nr:LysR substrate-binding domain-containing protein [Pokkaliibacter plantistimulans]PPC76551.1 LysR family transcriptional regulator [Pokkaliibacter plantistimulans]PXF31493.1 LysR family transcriptional regulator [Pokkaliibacter plantistimulans]
MMTLRQIRYFIAIAETGSISAAAAAVHISQSTLTTALKQLEDDLGAVLFSRHAKGMQLTHQGHQFLRQAHLILASVDNARRSLRQSTDSVSGQLNIGVTSLVAGYYLADLLSRFQRIYHQVDIRVVEDDRAYIEHLLVSGELDIGVLILSQLDYRSALNSEILTHSPYRLWLPPQHTFLDLDSISLTDLQQEPLIMLSVDEMEERVRALWQRAPGKPWVSMRSASVEAVRSLVAAGMGLALMPDMTYRPWSVEGDVVEARPVVEVADTLDIGLAWRRGRARTELIDHFLAVAREPRPSAQSIIKHPRLRTLEERE